MTTTTSTTPGPSEEITARVPATCLACGRPLARVTRFCMDCGAPVVLPADLTSPAPLSLWSAVVVDPPPDLLPPGTPIGEFRVERVIGMGAMGTVYGAVHPLIGKRVAIKLMRRDLATYGEATARFLREARAACRVHHVNVIDVFTYGTMPDGRSFLVMEWLEGETLRDRMDRPLVIGETMHIVEQLACGLRALHARGIVHRDLKPDNVVLIGEPPRLHVKIVDLGVAKLMDAGDALEPHTGAGMVIGTAAYSSPEQAIGVGVDPRSDIYSLGVLLFELLTGRRPFEAPLPVDVLVDHVRQPAPRVSWFQPDVPHELDELVHTMMAKAPSMRPSLPEVRLTLAHHLGSSLLLDHPRAAAPSATGQPTRRLVAPLAPVSPPMVRFIPPFLVGVAVALGFAVLARSCT